MMNLFFKVRNQSVADRVLSNVRNRTRLSSLLSPGPAWGYALQESVQTVIFFVVLAVLMTTSLIFVLKPMSKKFNQKLIVAIAVVVPAVAASMYMAIGNPDAIASSSSYQESHPKMEPARQGRKVESVNDLLRGLEARLEQEPNDADGWLLLAQSYEHVGRDSDAARAYAKARELGADVNRPGITATARSNGGIETGPVIHGTVGVSDAVLESIGEDDVVFVFAKESREHRMPVAAIRRPASSLPFAFELSNADVMLRDTDISQFESLYITARLSRSGMAADREGAVEAWSGAVHMQDLESEEVQLVLGQEVAP